VTTLRTGQRRTVCQYLAGTRETSSSESPNWLWGPPNFLLIKRGRFFPYGQWNRSVNLYLRIPHMPSCCTQGQREFTSKFMQWNLLITEQQWNEIFSVAGRSFLTEVFEVWILETLKFFHWSRVFLTYTMFAFKTDLTVLLKIVNLDYIANKHAWLWY
jgi:hypothetical protein